MTLRARLVAGLVLLLAIVIISFSLVTWLALKSFLVNQVDRQLLDAGRGAAAVACFQPPLPQGATTRLVSIRPAEVFGAALIGSDGTPLGSCELAPVAIPLELSHGDGVRLAESANEPVEIDADGEAMRAIARPASTTGDVLLVTSLSLSEVNDTLNRLVVLEAVVGTIALLGAAGLGSLMVHWGLRPLHGVTRTARTVASEVERGDARLEHRVTVDKSQPPEMNQLASAFNTMLESVEKEMSARQRSEERMRQFLADASHELRTPLTALRGYTELMRMQGSDATGTTDSLARMEIEAKRMSRLVSDLLVLARSDSQTPAPMEEFDLGETAAQAVASLRAAFPDREVSMSASGPTTVDGDPDQLQRVLDNLLVNAATHTDGPVRLAVRHEDNRLFVTVEDDGPGLEPEQVAKVFDRFWRADTSRTRARGGSGLGLPIVSSVIGMHGGTVEFDSSRERGTTVTVSLPAAR